MPVYNIAPGPEIPASLLLQKAYEYIDYRGLNSGGIRKYYYIELYDTKNNLSGRFIGQYIGTMSNILTKYNFELLILKTHEILDFSDYIDEDNKIVTLLFNNIRKIRGIGTGILGFNPIDYEECQFNIGVDETKIYNEFEILTENIGLEFPLEFAQRHMKFYDYDDGRHDINKGILDIVIPAIIHGKILEKYVCSRKMNISTKKR